MTSSALPCRERSRGRPPGSAERTPIFAVVAVLFVLWYLAAFSMNAPLVRDAFERERGQIYVRRTGGRNDGGKAAGGAGAASGGGRALRFDLRLSAQFAAQPRLSRLGHALRHRGRLRHRRHLRHRARHPDRAFAHAREEPAAVDHLFADGADPGDRADYHRRVRRASAFAACSRNRSSPRICAFSRSPSAW